MTDADQHILVRFWDSFTYYLSGLYHRIDNHHLFLMSGGVAFSMFVCIIPLLLIVLFVLGNFVQQPEVLSEIQTFIYNLIPYPEYAKTVMGEIDNILGNLSQFRQIAGFIGVLGIIFAGSSLFSSIRTILNTVFHPKSSIRFYYEKLWDFLLIIVVIILFLIFIFLLPLLSTGLGFAERFAWFNNLGIGRFDTFLIEIASMLLIYFSFFIVYWIVPVSRTKLRIVAMSALWGTLLWKASEFLFGYYITHVATLKHIYGVYAFLVIVAFWIYYSALSMCIAAEIGQLYYERWKAKPNKKKSRFFRDELEIEKG
ncbi:MAG: YihY/virulence factor BrkB family protein [Calditrichaeota bacterium]|nr:MAG: YihY/virulence factor BrkB family protein [Calditrichota bacterium]